MRKEPSWKTFLLKFTFRKVSEKKTDKKEAVAKAAKMKSQLLAWAGIKNKKEK